MRELLFISNGDATDASFWSNVPYCFSNTLEKNGYIIKRIDFSANKLFVDLYDLFVRRVLILLTFKKIHFPYLRCTRLFKFYAERIIKKSILMNKKADLCIFMGYGFYNKWTGTPSLLFSDWTTEMDICKKRKPNFLEKRIIRQEEEAINHAEYVISLFPVCCEEMKKKYPKANIKFLGGNVINDLSGLRLKVEGERLKNSSNEIFVEDLIEAKKKSKKLLFIGRKTTYLEAAKKLIEAYKLLKEKEGYKDYKLDIVGCAALDFNSLPKGVTCHGFLNKSDERDRKIYYDLLFGAKVLVNANPEWGAFSSTVEAMYYYTPVIVSPYQDFMENFSKNISFGIYNYEFSAECIADNIRKVSNADNYSKMCVCAHEAVNDYTWDNYVRKLFEWLDDIK